MEILATRLMHHRGVDGAEPAPSQTSTVTPTPPALSARVWAWWPAVAVLVAGLAATGAAVLVLRSREAAHVRLDVARRTADLASRVRSRLDFPVDAAAAVASFMHAVGEVDAARFSRFASGVAARQTALYALEFAESVSGDQRADFERRCGCSIVEPAGTGLTRAAERDRYLPILYSEPINPAIGFDLASEPSRRATTDRVRDEGHTIASERLRLIEDQPGVYSVVVYQPVWDHGVTPPTAPERRAQFRGAAIAIFRLQPVLAAALAGADADGLDLAIRDAHPSAAATDKDPGLLHESRPGAGSSVSEHPARATVQFAFADRTWELTVAPVIALSDVRTSTSALLIGLILSLAAATTVGALAAASRARKRAELARHLGQYRLTEPIGAGGVGVVYRAQHALLRRPTAIKLILPERLDPARLARFEREVQLTSQLTHPNTIAVYDYGHTPDGIFFYAMELVDGITFDELIHFDGAQPAARTVHLMRQLAGALAEAHAAHLIHRDLKPANAMVTRRRGMRDVVKVLDFGLAKELGVPLTTHGGDVSQRISSGAINARLGVTRDGGFFGTPGYASPEAIVGDPVDARADIYSLGAVWYALLTGAPPYQGESAIAVCAQQVAGSPPPPSSKIPSIPPELDALVLRCMAREPAARPTTAAILLDALEGLPLLEWRAAMAEAWWRGPGVEVTAAAVAARRAALAQVPPLRRRVVGVER
jgi:CHASE1-domain containing sensor protein